MSNIKMSGLISNMDTDSIVKELMAAQRTKLTKIENKKTKLTWTQEKWKDLNTKVYKFYTDQASKMRLQGSYSTYKATSSNESAVSVTPSSSAPEGAQKIAVTQLANAQSLISAKLGNNGLDNNGKEITNSTKLSDLQNSNSLVGKVFVVRDENGKKMSEITITKNTTMGDFVSSCKDAGLNANYDANQDRILISARSAGTENAYSFDVLFNANMENSRDSLYSLVQNSNNGTADNYLQNYAEATAGSKKEKDALTSLTGTMTSQLKSNIINKVKEDIKITDPTLNEKDPIYTAKLQEGIAKEYNSILGTTGDTDAEKKVNTQLAIDISTKAGEYKTEYSAAASLYPDQTQPAPGAYTSAINVLGLKDGALEKEAKDSIIVYNDLMIKSQSNTIEVNGLTINIKQVTDNVTLGDNPSLATLQSLTGTSVSVTKDTQATYDMVKKFVTDYNSLLKEMNTLYYAKTSKGYEPLTDEQKESMSDDQIKQWEDKIKDSLLRRDSTLGLLTSSIKVAMSSSVEVTNKSGVTKNYSLSSFGITTSKDYTEYGLLHIYGDKEDSTYSDKDNKLKAALEDDPEAVMNALTGIAQNLYKTMNEKMKSTSLRSALTFYNDKEMTKQQTQYTSDVKKMEKKLDAMENSYYKKFSAMETSLAKLKQSTSALSALMGS